MTYSAHIRFGLSIVTVFGILGCAATETESNLLNTENRNVVKRMDSIDIDAEDGKRLFEIFEFTPINGEVSGKFSIIEARKGFRAGHMPSVSIGCTNKSQDYWGFVRFRYTGASKLVADLERWENGKIKNQKQAFAIFQSDQDVGFKVQWIGGEGIVVSVKDSISKKIFMSTEEPICFLGGDFLTVGFENIVLMQYL